MRVTLIVAIMGLAVFAVLCGIQPNSVTAATLRDEVLKSADETDVSIFFPDKEVNARTEDLSTPLHWAAVQGHADQVKLLLSKRADVNAKDIHGWAPLHYAAVEGHRDVVVLLVSGGAAASFARGVGLLARNALGLKKTSPELITPIAPDTTRASSGRPSGPTPRSVGCGGRRALGASRSISARFAATGAGLRRPWLRGA